MDTCFEPRAARDAALSARTSKPSPGAVETEEKRTRVGVSPRVAAPAIRRRIGRVRNNGEVLRAPAEPASVVVLRSDRSKRRPASPGGESNRGLELEGEPSLGRDHSGPPAREQHPSDTGGSPGCSANPGALSAPSGCANGRARSSRASHRHGISSPRGTGGSLEQLRPNGKLLAIDQDQLAQFHSQLGHSLYAACFLGDRNAAKRGLASP